MKNTLNRFFVLIFGIFALCGAFTSCENLFGGKAPITYEKAYIRISTDMKKSVLPSEPFSSLSTGLTWTLTGIPSGGAVQELGKWSDTIGVTEADTTTAYNKMISDMSITLNVGTWTFTLTAANESGKLLEATITQTITGGQNTLVFDMKEAVGEGAASGQIDFTLRFPGSVIKKVEATLTSREDESFLAETEFTTDQTGVTETFLSEVKFTYSGNDNEALSAGNYILKLELQQQTGLDPQDKSTIYETINTYTCLIHVAPGLCSKGGAELKTLAQLYEVTFEGTEGIEFEEDIVSLSYNAYTTFALPTIKKEEGYEYQWYKTVYDIYSNSSSQESVDDPSNVRITENTTFGVKCYKIVAEDDIVRTAKGDSTGDSKGDSFSIGTAEGLGIFRDLVNGCNENLKMVDKSGESEDGYVYYDYGLVSYQSQLNAELTSDIDLTQLKDANGNELSWVPINGYSGTFDGAGKEIKLNKSYVTLGTGVVSGYCGLFSMVDGATIKDLTLTGEETIKCNENDYNYFGGFVGFAGDSSSSIGETKFINCVNKRKLTVSGNVGHIGGFVGCFEKNETYNSLTFENCINLGEINVSDVSKEPYAAGFTTGATSYTKCINAGNVTGASYLCNSAAVASGTVAGFDASVSASFTDCINLGNISANSYTADDGKTYSTEKVYGFSSIGSDNFPSFENCIDAGSANWSFTGVVDNTTGTYVTSYYNSDSYGSDYNTDYAKTSDELCQFTTDDLPNWNIATSRYPLPDIEENFSEKIWQEVEAKAIPKVSNFEMFKNRIASANGTADNPDVIVLNSDIIITETLGIKTYIKIVSTGGNYTLIRGNDFSETLFNVRDGGSLTLGDGTANIILDGGSTDEALIEATAPLITSNGSLTLNNCTLQNNKNSNATETGTGIYLQINDTSSLCSFNDVSFGENSSDEIPHIKIENYIGEKFTFNLGGSLAGGVPSIDMPSTTCINISESLTIPDGESIKVTLDEYTIGNRIISANEGINLIDEINNFSLTTTEGSWFIDSAGYLVGGSVTEPEISESEEYLVSSLDNLLWIALGLKKGDITSFNMKLTNDIEIPSGEWQFYQLNVENASTIDGQGHSITINEDVSSFGNDAGGLFYKFNNSTVKNLVLKGSITANTSAGGYIGALCRSAYRTTIQNVMSTVTIIDEGSGNAGGLVGIFGGNNGDGTTPDTFIKNCAVYANISSENGTAGGLVGESWENTQTWKIENCIYMGAVSSKNGVAGALIGNENTGRTSYLTDIWYCEANGCEIFGKEGNAGNITESGVVKLQTADDIASEAAATLLNTTSDGTSNDAWEYVSDSDYPTLKSVN
ncbi:MAG: hypothetical protein UIH41_05750 [Treponemataceae bacterium]|nr:hypothetical protein [Treponemataceae bacterium]